MPKTKSASSNRNPKLAARVERALLRAGETAHCQGTSAGSTEHKSLQKCQALPMARRVSDRHLLHLIKMWLIAPVEEDDGRGGKKRTTPGKDSGRGVPQGSPLSPLLGNLQAAPSLRT